MRTRTLGPAAATDTAPVRAMYRLQLRDGMTLDRARRLARYWSDLGVSHVYLSPVLRARRSSTHGYDVVDPTRVDPVLGGETALERLSRSLDARGIGILLDIVPNHMAAVPENPYFADVLAHGPSSVFAHWFDVDWRASRRGTHARLVLPVLGEPRESAIGSQRLRLALCDGAIVVQCPGHRFPVDPGTLPDLLEPIAARLRSEATSGVFVSVLARMRELPPRGAMSARAVTWRSREAADALEALGAILGESLALRREVERELNTLSTDTEGRTRLARFLDAQAYRLEFWRMGQRALNYRRFFNIDALIALRTEDATVFASGHGLVLELAARGIVDGLRIDHVDGLLEPGVYLARLRAAIARRLGPHRADAFPVYVEKILAAGEELPRHWDVQGTTGYEFIAVAEDLFVHAAGHARIAEEWTRLSGLPADFRVVAIAEKRRVLAEALKPDVDRLVEMFLRLRRRGRARVSRKELAHVVVELLARLEVYRVYLEADARTLTAQGQSRLESTISALRLDPSISPRAIRFLEQSLGLGSPIATTSPSVALAIKRLGQRSGPAAAKGVEDRAFYVHVPLASRNEVGAAPECEVSAAVSRFHHHNGVVARTHPATLLAATTHDTKRSADARSRLDVLSEIADDWIAATTRWRRWNAGLRAGDDHGNTLDASTEYLAYQSLLAIWPVDGAGDYSVPADPVLASLQLRLQAYMEKAAREAGRFTSWTRPQTGFERTLHRFVAGLLEARSAGNRGPFLRDFAAFAARVVRPGFWGSLSKLVLQLTAPGVPDIYQGEETWNLSLVDPDNRRPVDFDRRKRDLAVVTRIDRLKAAKKESAIRKLAANLEDGRLKTYVLRRGLLLRRELASVLAGGSYEPLEVKGPRAGHVVSFARRHRGRVVIVAVTRLALTLTGDAFVDPTGESLWDGTSLVLPRPVAASELRSELVGTRVRSEGRSVPLAAVFSTLPFAVLSA